MLWRNVPILMGSLLDTTCNFQFKLALASSGFPVWRFELNLSLISCRLLINVTIGQLFPISLKERWNCYVLYGENENRNLATCSSKFELKVASCVEQTPNQYWNIAPQHCRVPIKRTSGLTVIISKNINRTGHLQAKRASFYGFVADQTQTSTRPNRHAIINHATKVR